MASNSAPTNNAFLDALQSDLSKTFGTHHAVYAFTNSTKTLYDSKEYSDFALTCKGRLYKMHKSIVCPRSPVFAAMLRSPLQPLPQEGQNNTIDLPDDDVLAVHCMVRYFYYLTYEPDDQLDEEGFDYHEPSASTAALGSEDLKQKSKESKPTTNAGKFAAAQSTWKPHHALELHANVYVLADRYDVAALKHSALEKFKKALKSQWDGDAFVAAAHIAHEWTSESDAALRKSVLDAAFEHRVKLLSDPRLQEGLQSAGGLMYDLAKRMIAPGSLQLARCDSCSKLFS